MEEKLKKIFARCKCGVYLIVNQHRDYYQTAEDKLKELDLLEATDEIDPEVRRLMIETNTVVDLQFYPDTPLGSYSIYHYDIDAAIDEALECLEV
ncbi:MAG: hypothetical protein KAR06_02500 [Deltaproteobacteria bacterium]|nr:hypothetical protein [Deltaproteobacteria bacterium]